MRKSKPQSSNPSKAQLKANDAQSMEIDMQIRSEREHGQLLHIILLGLPQSGKRYTVKTIAQFASPVPVLIEQPPSSPEPLWRPFSVLWKAQSDPGSPFFLFPFDILKQIFFKFMLFPLPRMVPLSIMVAVQKVQFQFLIPPFKPGGASSAYWGQFFGPQIIFVVDISKYCEPIEFDQCLQYWKALRSRKEFLPHMFTVYFNQIQKFKANIEILPFSEFYPDFNNWVVNSNFPIMPTFDLSCKYLSHLFAFGDGFISTCIEPESPEDIIQVMRSCLTASLHRDVINRAGFVNGIGDI